MAFAPSKFVTRSAAAVLLMLWLVTRVGMIFQPIDTYSDTSLYVDFAQSFQKAELADANPYTFPPQPGPRFDRVKSKRPYEGVVEYPPLALGFFRAVAIGLDADQPQKQYTEAWTLRFRLVFLVVEAIVVVAILATRRRLGVSTLSTLGALAAWVVGGILLRSLLYERVDLLLGLVFLAVPLLLARRRSLVGCTALVAGAVALKVTPVLCVPVLLVAAYWTGQKRRRALLQVISVMSAVVASVTGAFYVAWGPATFDWLRYHSRRGINVDSMGATVAALLDRLGLLATKSEFSYGSYNLSFPNSIAAGTLITLFGVVLAMAPSIRLHRVLRSDPQLESQTLLRVVAHAILATVVCSLIFSKTLSPQYLLWLLPLAVAVCRPTQSAGWIGTAVATAVIFPSHYIGDVVSETARGFDGPPTGLGLTLLVIRNGLLLWLGISSYRTLGRLGSGAQTGQGAIVVAGAGETEARPDLAGTVPLESAPVEIVISYDDDLSASPQLVHS